MTQKFKRNIGERIKEIRNNLGYSQQEVARKLGLHRPSISQIERGERELSAEELTNLAEFFAVPIEKIIEDAKTKPGTGKKEPAKAGTKNIKITFFRHGEATDDIYDQYGGWADPELSPKGVNKAYMIAQELKSKIEDFEIIYTSPLRRARQVAEVLARELHIDMKIVQYLKERNTYGLLSGINKKVAKKRFPDLVSAYEKGKYVLASEREKDFISRLPLIFDYIKRSNYKKVCCITHGKVLKNLIKHMLNMKVDTLTDGCMLTVGLDDEDKMYFITSEGITFSK